MVCRGSTRKNADLKRGLRVPLFFVTVMLLFGCSVCGDERVRNVASPTGAWTASTFVRDCGATTDYATWVTLHSGSRFNRADDLVLVARGEHGIELSWKDAGHLIVDCRDCGTGQIVTRRTKYSDIEILYSH